VSCDNTDGADSKQAFIQHSSIFRLLWMVLGTIIAAVNITDAISTLIVIIFALFLVLDAYICNVLRWTSVVGMGESARIIFYVVCKTYFLLFYISITIIVINYCFISGTEFVIPVSHGDWEWLYQFLYYLRSSLYFIFTFLCACRMVCNIVVFVIVQILIFRN